ncbi:rod shape-determining protein MreD [Rubrobacter indicoceani]|uniref:rod shape-determining protein MreD n=1 Tax=Rubrobacter indicoceani TaxID=2051957 RepID=UPI000E5A7A35|nr:rod shape-determining protein MreD [Rubrobacter indicoceani]
MHSVSVVRAALIVACAAVLEVVVGPYLTFGWISPKFMIFGVVFAVLGMRQMQALLLGFFAGILFDAFGGGLFGIGSLAGLLAATLAIRADAAGRRGARKFIMAQVVALSVAAYDIVNFFGTSFAGLEAPPFAEYLFFGIIPDALVNGILAYLIGGWFLRAGRSGRTSSTNKVRSSR